MKLTGKRVLITGGSSGIGLALAEQLGAKGAAVVITGRREAVLREAVKALRAKGAHAEGVAADVTTEAGRLASLQGALSLLGGLDMLVNNAGGVRASRLEKTTDEEIRAMLDVNLLAPMLLTRAALPHLRASGDGSIVNITSAAALIGMPFYAAYCAAKAGLAQFGEALRRELKGEGVTVLTVYPSGTDTPMMSSSRASAEQGFSKEPAAAVAEAVVSALQAGAIEVIRGDENRAQMVELNWADPERLDERFALLKPDLEEAVKDHRAL
jgi:NAD(P)-dependent dehydrogenase (short-subunit alcohol dehydrogenase family)